MNMLHHHTHALYVHKQSKINKNMPTSFTMLCIFLLFIIFINHHHHTPAQSCCCCCYHYGCCCCRPHQDWVFARLHIPDCRKWRQEERQRRFHETSIAAPASPTLAGDLSLFLLFLFLVLYLTRVLMALSPASFPVVLVVDTFKNLTLQELGEEERLGEGQEPKRER